MAWTRAALIAAIIVAAAFAAGRLAPSLREPEPAAASPAGARSASAHIPYHVESWIAYCYGGDNAGCSSDPSVVRRWATYVESTNAGAPKSAAVCDVPSHPCSSVAYINDNNEYFGSCGWSDPVVNGGLTQQHTLAESAWVHAGAPPTYANRLFISYRSSCAAGTANTGLWVNRHSVSGPRSALSWFNAYYQREWGSRRPDYYMSDDTTVVNHFDGRPAYEYGSWRDLQKAQAFWLSKLTDKSGKPVRSFFNGCSDNTYVVTAASLVKAFPNIAGCISENSVSAANMANGRAVYALDNCARVSLSRSGGVYVNGPNEDETPLGRRQATALNLLCYVPGGRVVFWEDGGGDERYVNAYPEQGLYPADALQSMRFPSGCPDETISGNGAGNDGTRGDPCTRGGHNDLLAGGTSSAPIERREFARCYDRGKPIGACAVIWNMTGSPVMIRTGWLSRPYTRQMLFGDGKIEQGAALTYSRIEPTGASLAPYDALFLAQ